MFFRFYTNLFNKDKNIKGQDISIPSLEEAAERAGDTYKPFFDWIKSQKRSDGSYDETKLATLGKWYFRRYM